MEMARRTGSPSALVGALSASRVVVSGPANTELRLAYADEMVRLAVQVGDPELEMGVRLGRLADLMAHGDRSAADEDLDVSLRLASGAQQPLYSWRATAWNTLRSVVDGRLTDAERGIQQGLAHWPGEPSAKARHCRRFQIAIVRLLQGRASEVTQEFLQDEADVAIMPASRCLLSLLFAEQDRRSEAEAEFERFAADGFVNPPLDGGWLFGVAALAETCAFLADPLRAEILHALLLPFSECMVTLEVCGGGAAFLGSAAHHLAILATTMGDRAGAQRWFHAAIDADTRFGAWPWVHRTRAAMTKLNSPGFADAPR